MKHKKTVKQSRHPWNQSGYSR